MTRYSENICCYRRPDAIPFPQRPAVHSAARNERTQTQETGGRRTQPIDSNFCQQVDRKTIRICIRRKLSTARIAEETVRVATGNRKNCTQFTSCSDKHAQTYNRVKVHVCNECHAHQNKTRGVLLARKRGGRRRSSGTAVRKAE